MKWTEYTLFRKKIAAYDATYVRLERKASTLNKKLRAKDSKHEAATKRELVSAYNTFVALSNHLKIYVSHSKKHKHIPRVMVSPKNLERYLKNGVVLRGVKLKIDKLDSLYKWSLDCSKKLKKRITDKVYKL